MELLEEVHRAVWVELTSQVYVDEDTLATVQRTAVETTSDAGTRVFRVTSDRGGIATVRVEDGTVHCTCSVFKEAVVCGHIFATLLEHFDVNQVTFSEGPSAAADIIIHRIRSTRWLGEDTRAAASLAHQIALPAPVANPTAPAASAAPAAPAGPGGAVAPAARGAPGGAAAPAARGMLKNKRGVPRPTDALDAVSQVPQQVVAAIGAAPVHMHPAVEEPRIYHAAPGRRSSKRKSWVQLGEEGRQLPYWMR